MLGERPGEMPDRGIFTDGSIAVNRSADLEWPRTKGVPVNSLMKKLVQSFGSFPLAVYDKVLFGFGHFRPSQYFCLVCMDG